MASSPAARGFLTTRWSLVVRASDRSDPAARLALDQLCEAYWLPLFAFCRRSGLDADDAADRVQDFLANLLERGSLDADRRRGRFRSYLLGALRHHMQNADRRARSERRGGRLTRLPLQPADAAARCVAAGRDARPDAAFERQWALAVLERALARLREEYAERGHDDLFAQLAPVLADAAGGASHTERARALGTTEGAVKVALHRMRGRLRALLREQVAHTVADPADVDDELRELFTALG